MSHPASAPFVGAVLLATAPAGSDDPTLWSPVAGRPLLAWSLAALRSAPEIGPIALVVPQPRLADAARLIAAEGHADAYPLALPPGAPLATALDLTPQPPLPAGEGEARSPGGEIEAPRVIVLHDAARPLVTVEQVQAIVAGATETGMVVGAELAKETIKRVAASVVVETLPRDELALLVPPVAVRADVLPALLDAPERPSLARIMDYVAAALDRGIAVRALTLSGPSLAVTSPADLIVAEALLSRGPSDAPG